MNNYLCYLLCKEYEDKFNAALYLKLDDNRCIDVTSVVKNRNFGFKLKKEGQLEKSKAAFGLAADEEDPISQYELARLLGKQDPRFETLLKSAGKNLAHAKIELYSFYLQTKQYEKAYEKLQECAAERLHSGILFEIPCFPSLPEDCVVYGYEALENVFLDALGELHFIKRPTLTEALHESAVHSHNEEEKFHFYQLAATHGYTPSIVALIDHLKEIEKNNDERRLSKKLILEAKDGNKESREKLLSLIKGGDELSLGEILEIAQINTKNDYYIKLIEEAAQEGHAIAICMLGMMYYRAIGTPQSLGKGMKLLDEILPKIQKLAHEGQKLAQYLLGWVGLERQNYGMAFRWLSKSALFSLPALHKLGDLHQYGMRLGIRRSPTDPEQAKVCYVKAADLGYAPSQVMLGWLSLEQKNYEQALEWFKKGMSQGYRGCQHQLKKLHHEGEEPVRKMITELARCLVEDQNAYTGTKEWAKAVLKVSHNTFQENSIKDDPTLQAADNSQQTPLVQQNALQEEEEQKIDQDIGINSSSHDQQILSLTDILYDNPQAVAEAHISALMSFVGKNVSIPKTQMGHQNRAKESSVFNEELRSFLPLKKPSLVNKAPLVSLTKAAFLDEKLMAQAEYFTQTDFAFRALREAAEVGTVRILDGLPPAEEESILDSAFDWSVFSHLPWQWENSADFNTVL